MPLHEETASTETACISTAAVFDAPLKQVDGAPKQHSSSWWKLVTHNSTGYSEADFAVVWAVWLAGLVVMLVAWPNVKDSFLTMALCVICAVALSVFIPDNGEIVWPYVLPVVLLPLIVFKSLEVGGVYTFFIWVLIFVIIPILEYVVGVDVGNQTRTKQKQLHDVMSFRLLTLSVPPMILACLVYGGWIVNNRTLSVLELVGFSSSIGAVSGVVGIVVGHELCHKASRLEQLSGRFLLCAVGYGHFFVEHTLGHHKLVATHMDPATARYGEDFYSFLPRVVVGEFLSACELETGRLRRKGLPWWHNEIPHYFLCSASLCAGLVLAFGSKSLSFFVIQAAAAVLLFESVNYLEHYGLERRETTPGVYETVQPQHSWDSPARLTNHVLFKLQRHADHHAHAGKRYQILQAYEASPQLPAGYATMILLAFVPPLWRAVMHPRLMEYRATQVGQRYRYGPSPGLKKE